MVIKRCPSMTSPGITVTFAKNPLRGSTLFLCPGYVTYSLLTRPPLYAHIATNVSYDLHVLATPPAFVLSQDQTLRFFFFEHVAVARFVVSSKLDKGLSTRCR